MKRRDFMTASAAAGAALSLTGNAQDEKVENQINVALVGAGTQGRVLMNSLLKIPGVRFVAVADVWSYSQRYAQRYLGKFGHEVAVYEDYKEMLDTEGDKIDAVFCATPDFMHAPVTVDSLKAGKAIYCEKMMSNTLEGAKAMVQAEKDTGGICQIGHQRRSNPRYIHARDILHLREKLFGRLQHANAQWNRGVSEPNAWPKKYAMTEEQLVKYGYKNMHEFRNWRMFKKYGGGVISDLGAHQIDILNWMFNAVPSGVQASGGIDYYKDYEMPDNYMTVLDYDTPEGKARAFYQVLTTTSSGGFYERFMGDQGTLVISELPKWNTVYREPTAPEWEPIGEKGLISKPAEEEPAEDAAKVDSRESAAPEAWDIPVTTDKPLHMYHLENFVDAIRNGTPLNCPAHEAYKCAVTVFKIHEAVEKQARLTYDPAEFKI